MRTSSSSVSSRIRFRVSFLTGIAAAALVFAVPTWGAGSVEVLDLDRFGQGGDLQPAAAESLVDDGFYTQDMTAAAASREYFTAVYSVPSTIERATRVGKRAGTTTSVEHVPIGRSALGLTLSNPGDDLVDVTVSVRSADGVRNHLVRVEAGGSRGLGLGGSAGVESVVLLAFAPFEAAVDLAADGADRSETLRVMAPAFDRVASTPGAFTPDGDAKTINYCQEKSAWLRIVGSTGGYVIAYGLRSVTSIGSYIYDIEYPAGTLFHRGTGSGSNYGDPECKHVVHWTTRTDGSKRHRWYYLDDLVFSCDGPATATCTFGCSDYFTVYLYGSSQSICF